MPIVCKKMGKKIFEKVSQSTQYYKWSNVYIMHFCQKSIVKALQVGNYVGNSRIVAATTTRVGPTGHYHRPSLTAIKCDIQKVGPSTDRHTGKKTLYGYMKPPASLRSPMLNYGLLCISTNKNKTTTSQLAGAIYHISDIVYLYGVNMARA